MIAPFQSAAQGQMSQWGCGNLCLGRSLGRRVVEIGPPESIDPRDRRPKAFNRKEREEKNAKDAKKFANSGLGIGRQSR
jgi:hypothetical protein